MCVALPASVLGFASESATAMIDTGEVDFTLAITAYGDPSLPATFSFTLNPGHFTAARYDAEYRYAVTIAGQPSIVVFSKVAGNLGLDILFATPNSTRYELTFASPAGFTMKRSIPRFLQACYTTSGLCIPASEAIEDGAYFPAAALKVSSPSAAPAPTSFANGRRATSRVR